MIVFYLIDIKIFQSINQSLFGYVLLYLVDIEKPKSQLTFTKWWGLRELVTVSMAMTVIMVVLSMISTLVVHGSKKADKCGSIMWTRINLKKRFTVFDGFSTNIVNWFLFPILRNFLQTNFLLLSTRANYQLKWEKHMSSDGQIANSTTTTVIIIFYNLT